MEPVSDTSTSIGNTEKKKTTIGVEEDARKTVIDYYDRCYNQRRTEIDDKFERNWRQHIGIYNKNDNEDNEKGRSELTSRVYIKMTRSIGRAAKAAIVRGLLPESWFDIQAMRKGQLDTDPQKAMALKELLKNLYYKQKRKREISRFVEGLITYGTGVAKITPKNFDSKVMRVEERSMEPQVDLLGNPMGEPQVTREVMADTVRTIRPSFENIDIRNFYIDLYATGIEDAQGCLTRSVISKDEYKRRVKDKIYWDIKGINEQYQDGDDDYKSERLQALSSNTDGNKGIEILEYWGLHEGEEWLISVANRNHVVRMIANPLWNKTRPFILATLEEDPHMIYGRGIPDNCEGSQAALNHLWRAKLDNLSLINNAEMEIDVTKLYNMGEQDLKRHPGKTWFSKGGGAIQFHYPQSISNDANEVMNLERYVQEEAGYSKMLGGQIVQGANTATEVEAQMSAMNLNVNQIVSNLEQDLIIPMLTMDYEIIAQYMTDAEILNLGGPDSLDMTVQITREDVIGNYDFKPLGTSATIAKTQHNNAIIALRNAFGDMPWNWGILGRRYMDNLEIKGGEDIAPDGGVVESQMLQRASQIMGIPPEATQQMIQLALDPKALAQQEQHMQQQMMNNPQGAA